MASMPVTYLVLLGCSCLMPGRMRHKRYVKLTLQTVHDKIHAYHNLCNPLQDTRCGRTTDGYTFNKNSFLYFTSSHLSMKFHVTHIFGRYIIWLFNCIYFMADVSIVTAKYMQQRLDVWKRMRFWSRNYFDAKILKCIVIIEKSCQRNI